MSQTSRFWIKSFLVFIGSMGATTGISRVFGQISLFDVLAVVWPAVAALAGYWGGVIDTAPVWVQRMTRRKKKVMLL